jgi:hypothetical protein
MKNIKLVVTAVIVMAAMSVSGQTWNTNGDHIYNTNTGNVGIGINDPGVFNLQVYTPEMTRVRASSSRTTDGLVAGFHLRNDNSTDMLNMSLRIVGGQHEMIQSVYSSSLGSWLEYCYLNLATGNYEMRNGIQKIDYLNSGDVLFNNRGSVGIGTGTMSLPGGNVKLAVNGKILCEELEIALTSAWPDYVFNSDYRLSPLSEVDAFIKENNHLPGIPSANEIESNGLSVGEMNRLMMQKIEELTLYVIELEKKINDLEK